MSLLAARYRPVFQCPLLSQLHQLQISHADECPCGDVAQTQGICPKSAQRSPIYLATEDGVEAEAWDFHEDLERIVGFILATQFLI